MKRWKFHIGGAGRRREFMKRWKFHIGIVLLFVAGIVIGSAGTGCRSTD